MNNARTDEVFMPQLLEFCGCPSEEFLKSLDSVITGNVRFRWFLVDVLKFGVRGNGG